MMAHGGGVIEVIKENGQWRVVPESQYARRITPETEMAVVGPAAGHDLLKTNADPSGARVLGTLNNCAGGKTPWGTVLMAEENFQRLFRRRRARDRPARREATGATAFPAAGTPGTASVDRFDVGNEPNEPHRFGWMVEYDPYDPTSVPVKRTGARPHEARRRHHDRQHATAAVVAYTGDDERFEYLYTLRLERHATTRPTRHRQQRPARRRHALRGEVRRGQA